MAKLHRLRFFSGMADWFFTPAELIPEPGRALLGLIGLFGVFLRRRR